MAQEKEIKNFVFNYTDGTSETVALLPFSLPVSL